MKVLLTGWNFMRLLRLVLGVAILVQGIIAADLLSILLGVVFGGMAIANIGCCGAGACSINNMKNNKARRIRNEEMDNT